MTCLINKQNKCNITRSRLREFVINVEMMLLGREGLDISLECMSMERLARIQMTVHSTHEKFTGFKCNLCKFYEKYGLSQ